MLRRYLYNLSGESRMAFSPPPRAPSLSLLKRLNTGRAGGAIIGNYCRRDIFAGYLCSLRCQAFKELLKIVYKFIHKETGSHSLSLLTARSQRGCDTLWNIWCSQCAAKKAKRWQKEEKPWGGGVVYGTCYGSFKFG